MKLFQQKHKIVLLIALVIIWKIAATELGKMLKLIETKEKRSASIAQ